MAALNSWQNAQIGSLRHNGLDSPQEFRILRAGPGESIVTLQFSPLGRVGARYSGHVPVPAEELYSHSPIFFTVSDDLQKIALTAEHTLLQNGDILLRLHETIEIKNPEPIRDPLFESAPPALHIFHTWTAGHIACGFTFRAQTQRYLELVGKIPLEKPEGLPHSTSYYKFDVKCGANFCAVDALTILAEHYDFSESHVSSAWYVWLRKKSKPSSRPPAPAGPDTSTR